MIRKIWSQKDSQCHDGHYLSGFADVYWSSWTDFAKSSDCFDFFE
jgi:hypothetical protein